MRKTERRTAPRRRALAFLVWGAGGHGRVVADALRASGHLVAGFVDRDADRLRRITSEYRSATAIPEAPFLEVLRRAPVLPAGCEAVALGIGDNAIRLQVFTELGPILMPPVVHPSATVSPSARLGRGTVVLPGAVVNAGARIGHAVIVNSHAMIEHDCHVCNGAHIAPGATLAGGVTVGERACVGEGATAITGIDIGHDAIVGAGAIVIDVIAAGITVVGNPARPVVRA